MVANFVSTMIDLRQVTFLIWTQKVGFVPMWGIYSMAVNHIKIPDGFAPENLELYSEIDFRQVGVIRTAADHLGS